MEEKNSETACPFTEAMSFLSGKWTLSIINTLMTGTMRFSELERTVTGINTRMLARELKTLEANGLVYRKAYATVPPTVEYTLTEKGRSLGPVMQLIQQWATT